MKYLLIIFFVSIFNIFGFCQYPIKTKFKGDQVVIMTADQFESLDLMIFNQKNKNSKLSEQIQNFEKENDSLKKIQEINLKKIDSLTFEVKKKDSIQEKLNDVESWILETSIDHAWLYYDWQDSMVKYVDLSMYSFYGNKVSGRIILFRRSGSTKNNDLYFWKQVNRKYPQVFNLSWADAYRKKVKPLVLNFPFKVENPYKPKEITIINLNE